MIYLDNAATTFPKPQAVADAVRRHIEVCGGNPGRGAHQLSLRAAEVVYQCREVLSDLLGLDAPEGIVFTQNTTYALNMLLKGFSRGAITC
ncbi:MAG: aminotransferase class V-fold PLP-dependent enzyme [Clostridia bacterium]|nr:aminotransferase class V-fold PLP-dependent enzyme [Clostridia bacterium]